MRWLVIALPLALLACNGGSPAPDWAADGCLKHEDCPLDEACVLGQCDTLADDAPVDLTGVLASQWFTHADGNCAHDNECGPWACFQSRCVSPGDANRRMPSARSFRYWDTSCVDERDCGGWLCADGWCTQPGFVSPDATLAEYTPPGLQSCLADTECGAGGDCVFPGFCHPNTADEPMTFVRLGGISWYADPDGACTHDAECGPHACVDGWCGPQEFHDRPRPPRSNFLYYDASCSDDAACGTWICAGGFCQDPAFYTP